MKVAVLTGGSSTERELSLASAKNVCAALEEAGHRTVLLDASSDLVSALRVERPDVCFNALARQARRGRNRPEPARIRGRALRRIAVQRVPARLGQILLGSEMAAYRAITGDEPTASWPQGVCIAREAFESMGAATAFDLVEDRVIGGYPVAVKPAHGVSASGVRRVDSVDQLGEAVSDALSFDDAVIIEQWIDGVEVTVPVLAPAGMPTRCRRWRSWRRRASAIRSPVARRARSSCSHLCAPPRCRTTRPMPRPSVPKSSAPPWKCAVPIRCATSPALILSGTEPRRASWRWTWSALPGRIFAVLPRLRSLRFVAVRRPQRTGQPICAVTACGESAVCDSRVVGRRPVFASVRSATKQQLNHRALMFSRMGLRGCPYNERTGKHPEGGRHGQQIWSFFGWWVGRCGCRAAVRPPVWSGNARYGHR